MNGLIRVVEDWLIIVDDMNYIPAKDTHRTRVVERSGEEPSEEPVYDFRAYYTDLLGALQFIRAEAIRARLQGADRTLNEALHIIRSANDEFSELLKKAMQEGTE